MCHVKVLQYYPKQGLKIKRVHRTISFKSNYCWFHCHRCCGWCCWYGCCRYGCCSCCYCCMGCSCSWLRWRGGAGGCGGCGDDGEYFALAIFEALACNIWLGRNWSCVSHHTDHHTARFRWCLAHVGFGSWSQSIHAFATTKQAPRLLKFATSLERFVWSCKTHHSHRLSLRSKVFNV